MSFAQIAKDLRTEKGLSQMQLSRQIGISAAGIGYLELGKREPTSPTLIAYSKYFEVSADYLLGLEDDFGVRIASPVSNSYSSEESFSGISQKEKALLEAFRKLLPETQDFILRTAQSLQEGSNENTKR